MKTSSKIWMCLAGIALVALGVLCIMYPGSTLLSLAWLLGILLLLGGCMQFGAWVNLRRLMQRSGLTFLSAVLQIILGILLLIHPEPVMIAIPFIFAFWLLFEGIMASIGSFDFKQVGFRYWWIMLCLGLIMGCFGIYCLMNPNVSVETIAWIVGIGIIVDGIGYWIKLALVNKVEKRLNMFQKKLREAIDVNWEEVPVE